MTEGKKLVSAGAPAGGVGTDADVGVSDCVLQDHWLDSIGEQEREHRKRRRAQRALSLPLARLRNSASFLLTSPGLMTLVTFVISIAIAAAGLAMAQSSDRRQASLDVLISNAEPMSYSAHNVYTSLSIANTAATTGFVQAGVEDPQNRLRYTNAIARAGSSLAETAAGISTARNNKTDDRALELIIAIQQQLNIYTGLVETARTNNRLGNPVGTAYMSEASEMMRQQILPNASELFTRTTSEMMSQQSRLSTPQWFPISGLVAALIMLGLAQVWLARRTHRRLNTGYAAATVLMSLALLWVVAANAMTWQAGNQGFSEAAAPLNSLTNARILAQQAHTEETLALVLRQGQADAAANFQNTITNLNNALDEFAQSDLAASTEAAVSIAAARGAIDEWQTDHNQVLRYLNNGQYQQAIASNLNSPSGPFERLDGDLSALISDARVALRSYIREGLTASSAVPAMVLILSLLSIVSLWVGIRPRLQEYL